MAIVNKNNEEQQLEEAVINLGQVLTQIIETVMDNIIQHMNEFNQLMIPIVKNIELKLQELSAIFYEIAWKNYIERGKAIMAKLQRECYTG